VVVVEPFVLVVPDDHRDVRLHTAERARELVERSLTRLRLLLKRLRAPVSRADLGSDAVQRLLVRHHQAFGREGELRVALVSPGGRRPRVRRQSQERRMRRADAQDEVGHGSYLNVVAATDSSSAYISGNTVSRHVELLGKIFSMARAWQ